MEWITKLALAWRVWGKPENCVFGGLSIIWTRYLLNTSEKHYHLSHHTFIEACHDCKVQHKNSQPWYYLLFLYTAIIARLSHLFPKLSEGTVAEHCLVWNHIQNTAQCEKKETFCSFDYADSADLPSVQWWPHHTLDRTLRPSWVPQIFSPVMTFMAVVIFWNVDSGPKLYVDRHGLTFEPKPYVTYVCLLCGCHVPTKETQFRFNQWIVCNVV